MTRDPEQYRLSDEYHQEIFETQVKPKLFRKALRAESPVLVIFEGKPEAGKSASIVAVRR